MHISLPTHIGNLVECQLNWLPSHIQLPCTFLVLCFQFILMIVSFWPRDSFQLHIWKLLTQFLFQRRSYSLSAICEASILQYLGNRYVSNNSTDFIIQPPEIDTHYKCRDACLGPNGDGILPSGQSCHGSIFKNGRCRLAIAILDLKIGTHVSDGSIIYLL